MSCVAAVKRCCSRSATRIQERAQEVQRERRGFYAPMDSTAGEDMEMAGDVPSAAADSADPKL